MNRIKAITYMFFSLSFFNAHPLHIKDICNQSHFIITITYWVNDPNEEKPQEVRSIRIEGNSTQGVDFNLPENTQLLTRLDEAEHFLTISVNQTTFLCADGKRPCKDNPNHVRYGLWLQKSTNLKESQSGIRILAGSSKCYRGCYNTTIPQDMVIEYLNEPFTLVIDEYGTIL